MVETLVLPEPPGPPRKSVDPHGAVSLDGSGKGFKILLRIGHEEPVDVIRHDDEIAAVQASAVVEMEHVRQNAGGLGFPKQAGSVAFVDLDVKPSGFFVLEGASNVLGNLTVTPVALGAWKVVGYAVCGQPLAAIIGPCAHHGGRNRVAEPEGDEVNRAVLLPMG